MVGRGGREAGARHRRPLVVLKPTHRNREPFVPSGTSGSKPAQMAVPTEWANGSGSSICRCGVFRKARSLQPVRRALGNESRCE